MGEHTGIRLGISDDGDQGYRCEEYTEKGHQFEGGGI